jgi:4-hydroxy-tetrahydrodipicolinate reductase
VLILVLGKGKTGSLVAQVARERGHGVRALDVLENRGASALTAPNLAGVDVVIDFTSPESAVENMRAVLALGLRIVVGTTGWYAQLNEMKALAIKRGGALLYGTNFSIGVQKLFSLTAELARLDGYTFSIGETHHESKLDAPSGTAITLSEIVQAEQAKLIEAERAKIIDGAQAKLHHATGWPTFAVKIISHRIGDAKGEHIVTASGPDDILEIRHDALSRRGFALGAVRAAEWLAGKQGAWDFREIFSQL